MIFLKHSYKSQNYFKRHRFHIITRNDSLPFFVSLSIGSLFLSLINYYHYSSDSFFIKIYVYLFLLLLFDWFFTINKESINGFHTKKVQLGILKGMILFILSEIMFFFSIFWAFFHFKLNPSCYIENLFPPYGINIIKMSCFPLLNTVFLVYSGCFLMNVLNYIKKGYYRIALLNLLITLILGLFFVLIQFIEYIESFFSFNDSCYGSVFFLLTGFHGFHVIIGLIFLLICFFRIIINCLYKKKNYFKSKSFLSWESMLLWLNYHNYGFKKKNFFYYLKSFLSTRISNYFLIPFLGFKRDSNIGLICASWYWHFVDAVWIVVISIIYSDIILSTIYSIF